MLKQVEQLPPLMYEKLRPLQQEMAQYDKLARIGQTSDMLKIAPASNAIGSPKTLWEFTCCVFFGTAEVMLLSGFGFRLLENGNLTIVAAHVLRLYKLEVRWREIRKVPLSTTVGAHSLNSVA